MKAVITTSPIAAFIFMVVLVPLTTVVPRSHPSAIQQITLTDEEIYRQVLMIADQARKALQRNSENEAAALIQSAIKLSPKDDLTKAAIYNALGNLFARESYYQLAISQYEQGLMILSGSQDHDFKVIKEALSQLAQSQKSIGGYGGYDSPDLEIIDISDLETLRKRPTALQELSATLLINDGNVYLVQYQNRQAEGLYRRALEVVSNASLEKLRRSIYTNLTWSVIQQGRTDEANELITTTLKGVPASTPPVELRRLLLAIAVKLRVERKYSDAIARFEQVLPLYQTTKDSWEVSRATAHLATAYLAIGDPASAKALLVKVINDSSQNLNPEIKRLVHATFAVANWRLGDLETALQHFKIYLEQIDSISSGLLTEEGSLSFRETQNEILEDYVKAALALAEKTKIYDVAYEAIERVRARSLTNLIEARSSWDYPSSGQMSAELLLDELLARYKGSERDGVPATVIYRESALSSANVMNAAIVLTSGRCRTPIQDNLKEARKDSINTETTNAPPINVLEYYVLKEQTVAIVKNRDGKVSGISLPVGEAQLTELIDTYVQTLDVANRRGVKIVGEIKSSVSSKAILGSEQQIATKLYDLLIRPVRDLLPSGTDEQLLIVPHRALWYLPFASLAPRAGTRMIDEFLLTYAASEEAWKLTTSRPRTYNHQNARAWIVGNPTVTGGVTICGNRVEFADLPGAKREAEEIARLFGKKRAELFTGPQADRLRLEAWYPDFGVIHLAAHGVACPTDPFDSSIMLARVDGDSVQIKDHRKTLYTRTETPITLTVRSDKRFPIKVCNVPQSEWRTPAYFVGELPAAAVISRYRLNADLVTLSACQTGLGATLGEGMIGFTRAFQAAGARTLVVSLWSVSGEATRDLMVEFYTEYLKHGSKAVALRKAMMATRQKYPHPRMWAAFSLFGAAE